MANPNGTTTTTLAAGIPAIVGDAVARSFDIPVLYGTCKVKALRQGEGKTVKFPTLPKSTMTDGDEANAFSASAYTPGSGTATVVEAGFGLEVSDFALSSSALSLEEIIAELMTGCRENMEHRIASLFPGFTTHAPSVGPMTIAKVIEADAHLATVLGNNADLQKTKVLACSMAQYNALKNDILVNKGLNGIGTNPVNGAWNDGIVHDLMGIQILPSSQVSQTGTTDPVGLLYVNQMTIGAALQAEPVVVYERKAILPGGSIQGWVISVASRFGVCELRDTYGAQLQTS